MKHETSNNRFDGRNLFTVALFASILTFLVFARSVTCDFVDFDDYDFVLHNANIRRLDSNLFFWAFSTVPSFGGVWTPLVWISYAVDHFFWGLNPAGYHLTNVILHSINTGLVVVLAKMLWKENTDTTPHPLFLLFAGLLWGMHPLRVESVSWVAERKDVLNGLFYLGSLLCYLRFVRKNRNPVTVVWGDRNYLLSLGFFILSLMAKPVSVVLPCMLLTADWFPLRRLRLSTLRVVILEKLPFLLCSGAVMVTTMQFARHSKILASYDSLPFLQRLAVSGNALFEYCRYMLIPAGILPLHTLDASQMTAYTQKSVIVVIITVTGLYILRKERWPVAVVLGFLLPLLPVLALFQNGIQAFAARYTYLPSLAPSMAVAFFAGLLCRNNQPKSGIIRRTLIVTGVLLVVVYGATTWRQIGIWKSTETVWSRIIDLQPTGRAYKERGVYYLSKGLSVLAERDLTSSLGFARRVHLAEIYKLYAFRGVALLNQRRYNEAVEDFSQAISLCPDPRYFYHRGKAYETTGKSFEAEADFLRAGSETGPIEWGNSACQ